MHLEQQRSRKDEEKKKSMKSMKIETRAML
jgi:hypothetical protein